MSLNSKPDLNTFIRAMRIEFHHKLPDVLPKEHHSLVNILFENAICIGLTKYVEALNAKWEEEKLSRELERGIK